jgi:hypothetical protein
VCPEILGTNPAVGKKSDFGQVVDGGGHGCWGRTCPIRTGRKRSTNLITSGRLWVRESTERGK